MLGITYHNPATITVFLDRMRFRDCFISTEELKSGEWKRKLKAFIDLPSDGRERVLFVESFVVLQTLVHEAADLTSVKVAVYDECNVLSRVPDTSIVDAHVNGSETDTWQLYTVSFDDFNDALAAQPAGVPSFVQDHRVDENEDLPEQLKRAAKPAETADAVDEVVDDEQDKEKPVRTLVMEQILDDIESGDGDEEEPVEAIVYEEPNELPDVALTARPEVDHGSVSEEEPLNVTTECGKCGGAVVTAQDGEGRCHTCEASVDGAKQEQKATKKKKRTKKPKAPKLESYELF